MRVTCRRAKKFYDILLKICENAIELFAVAIHLYEGAYNKFILKLILFDRPDSLSPSHFSRLCNKEIKTQTEGDNRFKP